MAEPRQVMEGDEDPDGWCLRGPLWRVGKHLDSHPGLCPK